MGLGAVHLRLLEERDDVRLLGQVVLHGTVGGDPFGRIGLRGDGLEQLLELAVTDALVGLV